MAVRTLTKKDARRVLEVVDAGLVSGLGVAKPGKMCVEAAICFALDMPHGDQPDCVAACIRTYKIKINDSRWSSNAARTAGMRRAAIAQLGSDFLDLPENRQARKEFVMFLEEQVIRQILPVALRAAALKQKDKVRAEQLVDRILNIAAEICVQACIKFKTPGSKWLDLAPKVKAA